MTSSDEAIRFIPLVLKARSGGSIIDNCCFSAEIPQRELDKLNAHESKAFQKRLRNTWPESCVPVFFFKYETQSGAICSIAHFCKGEADWRAEIYQQAGTPTWVETRYIAQGESYALVNGRQQPGCDCDNCRKRVTLLSSAPKKAGLSKKKIREMIRQQSLEQLRAAYPVTRV